MIVQIPDPIFPVCVCKKKDSTVGFDDVELVRRVFYCLLASFPPFFTFRGGVTGRPAPIPP